MLVNPFCGLWIDATRDARELGPPGVREWAQVTLSTPTSIAETWTTRRTPSRIICRDLAPRPRQASEHSRQRARRTNRRERDGDARRRLEGRGGGTTQGAREEGHGASQSHLENLQRGARRPGRLHRRRCGALLYHRRRLRLRQHRRGARSSRRRLRPRRPGARPGRRRRLRRSRGRRRCRRPRGSLQTHSRRRRRGRRSQ